MNARSLNEALSVTSSVLRKLSNQISARGHELGTLCARQLRAQCTLNYYLYSTLAFWGMLIISIHTEYVYVLRWKLLVFCMYAFPFYDKILLSSWNMASQSVTKMRILRVAWWISVSSVALSPLKILRSISIILRHSCVTIRWDLKRIYHRPSESNELW